MRNSLVATKPHRVVTILSGAAGASAQKSATVVPAPGRGNADVKTGKVMSSLRILSAEDQVLILKTRFAMFNLATVLMIPTVQMETVDLSAKKLAKTMKIQMIASKSALTMV
jgi:hypothetical protein